LLIIGFITVFVKLTTNGVTMYHTILMSSAMAAVLILISINQKLERIVCHSEEEELLES
jgi:hypothetical protein